MGKETRIAVKAFAVTENCENTGGIVFAKHSVVARRIGAEAWGDGDFSYVSCRRAPWADQYADTGIVPAWACVAHGWNFKCHYCDARIDGDYRPYRTWTPEAVVGSQNGAVFCDRACKLAHDKRREQEESLKERVVTHYGKRLSRRLPGISVRGLKDPFRGSHVYVTHKGRIEQIVIGFDWPGQDIGPAHFRWDKRTSKGEITCCAGDKAAFEAFAAQAV